jgi:hypothetical protein
LMLHQYLAKRGDTGSSPAEAASDDPPQQRKEADPTKTVFVAMHVVDVTRQILPLTLALPVQAPVAEGRVASRSAAVAQDAVAAAVSGSREQPATAELPPLLENAMPPAPSTTSGPLAFAARLSPSGDTKAAATDTSTAQDPGSPAQASTPIAPKHPATAVQIVAGSSGQASKDGDRGGKESPAGSFAKPEVPFPSASAPVAAQSQTTSGAAPKTSTESPAPAPMERVLEPPTPPSGSNRDITVRVSDGAEKPTDVRFVERNGEVHVSVRSADTEMAQSLRSGLNDLAGKLESAGIQTELWHGGSQSSSSQGDSQNPSADPNGSGNGGGGGQGGSPNDRRNPQDQPKPRWVEALEASTGNQTNKETSQPLWQL